MADAPTEKWLLDKDDLNGTSVMVGLAVVLACATCFTWASFFFTARAACRSKLGRNSWAGIRTPKLLKSEEAWRTGHAAALRWTKLEGVTIVPGALVFLFLVGLDPTVIAIVEGLHYAASLVFTVVAVRAAYRAVDALESASKLGESSS